MPILDEKPYIKEELDMAIDNFTNDNNVNQIDYYYSTDPTVITETDNEIKLLKDKARRGDFSYLQSSYKENLL